jgi:hypothetical protein
MLSVKFRPSTWQETAVLKKRFVVLAIAALCLIPAGMLAAPALASAQSAVSDEYNGVDPNNGNGNDNDNGLLASNGGNDSGGGPTATVESNGGSLPFTGYPITPLVAFMLALLAAGAVIRLVSRSRTDSRS